RAKRIQQNLDPSVEELLIEAQGPGDRGESQTVLEVHPDDEPVLDRELFVSRSQGAPHLPSELLSLQPCQRGIARSSRVRAGRSSSGPFDAQSEVTRQAVDRPAANLARMSGGHALDRIAEGSSLAPHQLLELDREGAESPSLRGRTPPAPYRDALVEKEAVRDRGEVGAQAAVAAVGAEHRTIVVEKLDLEEGGEILGLLG